MFHQIEDVRVDSPPFKVDNSWVQKNDLPQMDHDNTVHWALKRETSQITRHLPLSQMKRHR